jgi:hypothetical protein
LSLATIGADPAILWRAIVNPETRSLLWRFLLYREPLKPSGSTDFMVYVRRDLASGPWAAPLAGQQTAPDADAYAARTRVMASVLTFGSKGSGPGQFSDPKGVAVGPDGSVYVTDGANHRVEMLDPTFKPVAQWPIAGWEGESVVNKPYLAVDSEGNVYATDPEAHRVLEFGAAGNLLAVWGREGSDSACFRLPLGLAVDGAGNVLVVDSQNSRVMKFGPVR